MLFCDAESTTSLDDRKAHRCKTYTPFPDRLCLRIHKHILNVLHPSLSPLTVANIYIFDSFRQPDCTF